MTKTTRQDKQLELPIMVDMNLRAESKVVHTAVRMDETGAQLTSLGKRIAEASPVDLSIYDAISSNYVRGSK